MCIIGGGPAGSFAAMHLLRLARARGLSLDVQIFEPRNFEVAGPAGCNRCAGILSSHLLSGLDQLGLSLPAAVIRGYIRSYAVHLDDEVYPIEAPSAEAGIVSVYRGGGPRLGKADGEGSFDEFLLSQACAQGARRVAARVRRVRWGEKPLVQAANEVIPADLVVLATGVNSRSPLDTAFGYRPPRTDVMAQDEIWRPRDWPNDVVRTYFRQPRGLVFGALIPKGDYLNISLLGDRMTTDSVSEFLDAQGLSATVPLAPGSLCGCTPRIAVRPAGRFFGHRWVAVGDAAATRLYKDGIGSAFVTARAAMEAAVEHGVDAGGFRQFYAPVCRTMARDNMFGQWLFRLWSRILRTPVLLRAWKAALRDEASGLSGDRTHMRILWGMFTGDEPYATLLLLALSPASLSGLWRASRRSRRSRDA
ncbi:MAG TPA: hypothetical protein VFI11_11785 [Anaerolineales bacterium]|nr:hypothetical protein [Anaerolineales bacterium]